MKNNVKQFRSAHNYSQDSLARELGVSRQTIISIEKGKYNPSLPLALHMAKLFHAHVEQIFILDDEDQIKK
ncbi:helix-turn-helix transcriptional regulator [Radiobacillus sp. PE A8.2]|uniref:helix-turn-helix transcriptional regulator n=1 Tax=Radiobacillus sp. PE A8.2 TaxID=3380349 RepID=UPI00389049DC